MMPINPRAKPAVNLARLLKEGVILLDVRTEEEFVGCHLDGAVNIPFEDIEANLPTISRWKRPVIVYGADDQRSLQAVIKLHNHGIAAYDGEAMEKLRRSIEEKVEH